MSCYEKKCTQCGRKEECDGVWIDDGCNLESEFRDPLCIECKDEVLESYFEASRKLSVIELKKTSPLMNLLINNDDIDISKCDSIDVAMLSGDDGGVLHMKIVQGDTIMRPQICGIDMRKCERRFRDYMKVDGETVPVEWCYKTHLEYRQFWQEDFKDCISKLCEHKPRGDYPIYADVLELFVCKGIDYLMEDWELQHSTKSEELH